MLNPQAIQAVQQYLVQFAATDNFESTIESIFGTQIGSAAIRQQWLSGDFSLIPHIRVVANGELGTANGAYAASLDEILVSADFLAQHQGDVNAIADLLMEEIGHKIDVVLNGNADTPGDEGAMFRAIATRQSISPDLLAGLRTQDDRATIMLDGRAISIETQNFTGTNGNDVLVGTSGNDTFNPLRGSDTIDGAGGNDTLTINNSADTVATTITYTDTANGTITGGFNNGTTFKNIEGISITTGSGNDNINVVVLQLFLSMLVRVMIRLSAVSLELTVPITVAMVMTPSLVVMAVIIPSMVVRVLTPSMVVREMRISIQELEPIALMAVGVAII
jgi:RTX calcium-binding nonapeptide repeat (4 copies)